MRRRRLQDRGRMITRPFRRGGPAGRARRGFTLLEIMLAMALVALLLVALNTFVFSMGEL